MAAPRTWLDMDAAPRIAVAELKKADVPEAPGVYAWYRTCERQYVGETADLQDRIWSRHLGRSRSLGTSALRRNVAESLGFGSAAEIKAGHARLREDQLAAVRAWIEQCDVAWLECSTEGEAILLEDSLKREFLPPLTKI